DALEIALRVAGIRAGDKVLTTPLSAFATTLAILRAGGTPVFVDVNESGLLDLELAERRLEAKDIRFILPVHLFGHAHDLQALAAMSQKHGAILIEDCAQSILAKSRGALTGSVGLLSATSFYPTKNLGCLGDGGALLTNDEQLAQHAKALRDYGQSSKYLHDRLGLNSRLDELQAAFLISAQLPRLEDWTARRISIAAEYSAGLKGSRFTLPPVPEGSQSVWHLFPILVDSNRDGFLQHLKASGIGGGVHYPHLIPHQDALRGVASETSGSLEKATRFAQFEVSLPIHPFMSVADVERVLETCLAWRG
ncbi:MAG TPA: DegT/DnrJ/EryC1/StrS family aminotransferase, partial [Polyangiaceae bacterium]